MTMTTQEKIKRVQIYLADDPTAQTEVIEEYLDIAGDRVLSAMYPYGYDDTATIPTRYDGLQCELAARMFARRGGLGEIIHNENGTNRTWGSEDDRDIIGRICPMIKIVATTDEEDEDAES